MVRHVARTYSIIAAVLMTSQHIAVGQYNLLHRHQPPIVNGSCGVNGCPARVLSYGFYQENWRRWPDERSSGVPDGSLSPFVVPDRDFPETIVPSSRDEASQVIRQRTPIEATPEDAGTSASSPAVTPPRTTPAFPDETGLPSNLPGDQPSGAFPSDATDDVFPSDSTNGGGVFPSDDPLPGSDALPGNDEEDIFSPQDSTLPGNDSSGDEPALPGVDDSEIEFDPLDLGLNEPRRKHAVMPVRATKAVPSQKPRQLTQLMARDLAGEVDVDLRKSSARGNPLRSEPAGIQIQTASQVTPAALHQPTSIRANPLRTR